MKISPKRYGLSPGIILVFVLLASGILGGGLLFNRAQEQQLKQISENELAAIARLKMSQIVQWRKERLGNAGYIMESRFASKWLEENTISRGGAMIVLTNGTDAAQTSVEAGIGKAFESLAERLRRGKLPPCCEAACGEK